jgi:Putative zinc-finger
MSAGDNFEKFSEGRAGSNVQCAEISTLLVFYACGEVNAAEKEQVDRHLAACAECSEQLAQERLLLESLSEIAQPADSGDVTGLLLAQCRSDLAEKLDDLTAPVQKEPWQPFGCVRRWIVLRPVLSGAALVIFGVVLGTQLLPWWQSANDVSGPAVEVLAAPKLTDEQLSKMAVSGIRFSPGQGASGEDIQLHLNAEQPMELSGNVNDSDVRRVLTYVVENGARFDTGLRLDCLDVLRSRADDAQVRQVLLSAARKDENAAVRIKALESLRDSADDAAVHEMLLGILTHDASPGVRIEAVNLLVRSLEQDARSGGNAENGTATLDADSVKTPGAAEHTALSRESSLATAISALTELQQKDPSRDVRLRSAAALRQIGTRASP